MIWGRQGQAARSAWRAGASAPNPGPVDIQAIRRHFAFPGHGRIVMNNAASTQPPRELVALYQSLAPGYENVHRGQSSASQQMTTLFEESYDTIAPAFSVPPGPSGAPQSRPPWTASPAGTGS